MAILITNRYRHLNKRISLGLLMAMFTLMYIGNLQAQSSPTPVHQVKAAFLFNFTQFVEWPSSAFQGPETPLVIGVLGEDPFRTYLDEIIRGEKINGHMLLVKRFKDVAEVKDCHILFISPLRSSQLKSTFENLRSQHVLTVGDGPQFADQGGMIAFVTDHNKVRIRVNLDVVKESELTISSKLLRLAEIVSREK